MTEIKLVVFDMDGTLLKPRSCWAYIHDYFGTDNSLNLQRFINGELTDESVLMSGYRIQIGKFNLIITKVDKK